MHRRAFLSVLAASPLISQAIVIARAETPADALVMASRIDGIISLDPHVGFEAQGSEITPNIYETLVAVDARDGAISAKLAESWEFSEGGALLTFKLRSGRKFSSGNPISARDAEYSFRRVITLKKGAFQTLAQFGFTTDNMADTIRATDDQTFVLRLSKAVSPNLLFNCLASPVGSIIDTQVVESNATDDDMGSGWLNMNSAGSGAYVLKAWRPSDRIILDANPNSAETVSINRVIILHVAEPSSQLLQLERGHIDIARNLTPEQLASLEGNPEFNLERGKNGYVVYLGLNFRHPVLSNPKVVEALKFAVDYEGLHKNVLPFTSEPLQSFLPQGVPGALDEKPFTFDPERAAQLLKEAGFEQGFDITLDHASGSPTSDIAQVIQQNLDRIGVHVTLLSSESRQLFTKHRERNFEIILSGWALEYPDPHPNAMTFAYNVNNSDDAPLKSLAWRSGWDIPKLSKKVIAASEELDEATRKTLYADIQRDHQRRSPMIMLFQQNDVIVARQNISGLTSGLTPAIPYYLIQKA